MMIRSLIVLTAAAAATTAQAGPDPDLGTAVRANVATQAVDLHPDYGNRAAPGTSGQRAADAMIRYQTGKLKPLLKTNGKTDVGGQGGANDQQTVSIPLISSGPN